jgi:hypothetical protein
MTWISLAVSAASALGVLYLLRANKQYLEASTSETQSRAARSLTESYEDFLTRSNLEMVALRAEVARLVQEHATEVASMKARMDALENHNSQLTMWSQLLFSQVVEAGATPIPFERVQRNHS